MRYDPEHKQRTHDRVVHEAAKAIRQHGPDKISVASLMGKAGLTHGGFYAHFKSKDDLVGEAISHMFDDRHALFQRCVQDVPAATGLARFIDLYLSVRHLERREHGCPVVTLAGDVARMSPTARKRFEAGVRRMTDSVAALLTAMQRPDPESLAASMIAEMVGAVTMARSVSSAVAEEILDAARRSVRQRAGLEEIGEKTPG